ncbi:MAG TPA: HAMP domain-containing sensor histidine kinase [Solirubrobacteraceae bacterium]|nr:HAMP domain-containing sensor histidine kinase [Solirubrobacteraceae bacterium]
MHRPYGLRPRLLAALVFTSAATLLVAAFVMLGPLQEQLRTDTATNLESAVEAARPDVERNLRAYREGDIAAFGDAALLSRRADARALVWDTTLVKRYDRETGDAPATRAVVRALIDERTVTRTTGDEVTVTTPLYDRRADLIGVLEVRKPLTDVGETVQGVRDAFLTAAAIGLIVALVLGTAFSRRLTRRLGRLQRAALRMTGEGIDAPPPRDDTRDEVGDLARALASMHASLRRQEAARRAFVSTASHELRTPLTLLQGMLELLDDDLSEGRVDLEDAHAQISGAQKQLRRLEHLASDLLDLSRLDAEVPLRSEPVELGELTRAVGAEFGIRAGDKDVRVEVEPPIAPCWALGDPSAVAQIVRILLDNALRFAPAGTAVTVRPAYHGEHATVEVQDRGPGVPEDERERIFMRFERGSETGGEEGFGLGLAIGRELAQRLDGRLELIEPTRGATFRLSLPIELPAGSHPRREPEPVA